MQLPTFDIKMNWKRMLDIGLDIFIISFLCNWLQKNFFYFSESNFHSKCPCLCSRQKKRGTICRPTAKSLMYITSNLDCHFSFFEFDFRWFCTRRFGRHRPESRRERRQQLDRVVLQRLLGRAHEQRPLPQVLSSNHSSSIQVRLMTSHVFWGLEGLLHNDTIVN